MVTIETAVDTLLTDDLQKLDQAVAQAEELDRVWPASGETDQDDILYIPFRRKGEVFAPTGGEIRIEGVGPSGESVEQYGFEVETVEGTTLFDRRAYATEPRIGGHPGSFSSDRVFAIGTDPGEEYVQAVRQDHGKKPFVFPDTDYIEEEDNRLQFEPHVAVRQVDKQAARNAGAYQLCSLTDDGVVVRLKRLTDDTPGFEGEAYTGQTFSL